MTRKVNMKKDKLHNIKSTGFKTPDHYFDNFEARLKNRLSSEDKIESIETTGFNVPDNYFDTFEENILQKLSEEDGKPVVQLFNRKKIYYITGIAASLILLLSLFINKGEVSEISVEMVETYLENQDLDSYELAQLLSDADVLEENFTITETNYTEENLESYLLDNVDIETMLE